MISQVAPLAKPKARGYFGIDAKVYGHMGHVDPSALKVLRRPCLPSCLLSATLSLLAGATRWQSGRWESRAEEASWKRAHGIRNPMPVASCALAAAAFFSRRVRLTCPSPCASASPSHLPPQVPSASHIYACSAALNNFNDGWSTTAPTGC